MSGLERLFRPRGIAVVGASADATRPGAQTLRALRDYGYCGAVYPVNPKYREIAGYRCYPALAAIDGECDVAVIALAARQVPAALVQCGERGIGFAVVLAGGFREAGPEGAQLEAALLAAARAHGVRVVGPNCLGLVNVHERAYCAFGSLTRPPRLEPGAVSAVLQSASFGVSILIACAAAAVGFRYVVTSGNEADLGAPELIEAYVADPATRVVLAYLEGVADGRALMHAAEAARAAGKPLVVFKTGNSAPGKRAAASHTAHLTGEYEIYRAAFRGCGMIEVRDVHEAADVLQCLVAGRLPRGRRVVVIGGSGGAAAAFCDAAAELGLELPALGAATLAELKASLPPLSALGNPTDYTAGYPRAAEGLDFRHAFQAALADPQVDQMAVMLAAAGRAQLDYGAEILAQVAAASDKPVVVFSAMNEALAPEGLARLRAAAIPVIGSPRRAAIAMARLAEYAQARRRAAAAPRAQLALPALAPGRLQLNEYEAKRLLAAVGLPVSRDRLLPLAPAEADCAGLRFPLALKIVSPDIAHKSDIGGVRLGIADAAALVRAATEIVARVRSAAPGARLDGLLASELVEDGIEAVAAAVNDAVFGPVLAFGLGGVFAEALHDMTFRIAPVSIEEAREMPFELKGRALFSGARGRPAPDLDALARALASLSQLAWALRERLVELEINPLLVRPQGLGVVAADALVALG